MPEDIDVADLAGALLVSIGLLLRRVRAVQVPGDLSMPEISALVRLDRGGPMTSSALAKLEQISPQSMGATLAGLEARGLLDRQPDPADGRRIVLSVSARGAAALRDHRSARADYLARALNAGFTRAELARLQMAALLLERLGQGV